MAACCTYHRPANFSWLLNKNHTKKAYLLTKSIEEFSGKSSEEWVSRQKKRYDRKNNRTRQKNKRGDSKVDSNDSPEIPDNGETSDIPASLRGSKSETEIEDYVKISLSPHLTI